MHDETDMCKVVYRSSTIDGILSIINLFLVISPCLEVGVRRMTDDKLQAH